MRVFDAHLHIVDPRFPLVASRGYLPPAFTVEDYRARVAGLGVRGGAVVSGSFQALDQTYLLDALERLGPRFVGVTQLPPSTPDARIAELHRAGGRAVRFNLYRRRPEGPADLERLAHRVADVAGWHVEVYAAGRELAALEARLGRLPRLSVDHLGMDAEGLAAVLRLVDRGARVKATGFGRVDVDVPSALRAIASANPDALLFGTDLPSTRARRPFADGDVALLEETLGHELAARALHDNAVAWYRPRAGG